MVAIGHKGLQHGTGYITYITSTTSATGYGPTDTDTSDFLYYDEYVRTDVEEKINKQIMRESLNIPSFKVVKKLNNTIKVKTFVENRQLNFHIRSSI